jgi:hypothetical protein
VRARSLTPHFIRVTGATCSIIKIRSNGEEEVVATGMKRKDAELQLFLAFGEVKIEPQPQQLEFEL